MKKQLLTYVLVISLGFGIAASAHATTIRSLPDIFNALGVQEPTLLPDSSLYFVKDWSRGIRLFFTFGSVKKAELEARFDDERIAEVEKLVAEKPDETNALNQALQNYLDARNRLTQRLESLKGTNKNIDALLEKIANQTIEHQKLLNNLPEGANEETVKEAEKTVGDAAKQALELDEKTFKEKLKEKIKRDEGDTEDLDALNDLNDSDKDLNESLGDIQDELETETGTSTEEFEKTNAKELEGINDELDQEQPEETQNSHTSGAKELQQGRREEIQNENESSAIANQEPQEQKFNIEADDSGFYPSGVITVTKGAKIKIEFLVRTANVYYGGLRFKSPLFEVSAKPGETTDAEFTADNSFIITSYWPLTDVKKADLQIQVR